MTTDEKTILLVDDEEAILKSLTRVLMPEKYRVLTAVSGVDGLDILKKETVHVIVSDIRMPDMDGIEFLSRSLEITADPVRIALSGYAEVSLIIDSLNKGAIWRYLTKPWNDFDLKIVIRQAFEYYFLRADRARLVKELETVNHYLDQKVHEKTKELAVKNEIMDFLLDGGRLDESAELILGKIKTLFPSIEHAVMFYVPDKEEPFYFGDFKKGSSEVTAFYQKCRNSKKKEKGKSTAAFPLIKADTYMGVYFCRNQHEITEHDVKILSGFTKFLTMVVSDHVLSANIPEYEKNIDKVLSEL